MAYNPFVGCSVGETMSAADFEISLAARDGLLALRVCVSRSTGRNGLDAFMAKVIDAFAYVEGVDSAKMKILLARNRVNADDERTVGFVLKWKYTDPGYPAKLDEALRGGPQELTAESVH
jgi:hypothetical protein